MTPVTDSTSRAGLDRLHAAAFEVLAEPTLLLDDRLRIRAANLAARQELGPIESLAGVRCCKVLGCGTPCPAQRARDGARRVQGAREASGPDDPPREILAVPLEAEPGVVVQLREAAGGATLSPPPDGVRIHVLGPVTVERRGDPVAGDWLDHRPGEVFKYLVCARGRTVSSEELLDALWPHAGRSAIGNVRQTIHMLRSRLEAGFAGRDGARLIASRRGGYTLNQSMCTVDADEFEQVAVAALGEAGGHDRGGAAAPLSRAAELYTGDLLAETPYADWAFGERDRLRSLAARVLWELAEIERDAGDLAEATRCLYRLAELEPLELRAQRRLLSVLIRRGQHSEAARRFDAFCARYRRAFGQDPDLTLANVG